ncbi:MAG: low molecular weight protein-tyrosine-phosphatase [Campylobacterota bacterium]|nr:low molecular weight protein-tyrosine-phosphatase [Campylobacterota bacterium]
MKSVIFVCLGNICRSPIAEGIAHKIAKENDLHVKIDSAGTGHWHVGEAPCENSIRVANEHNTDISMLRARKITQDDINTFDLIIALDDKNYADLKAMGAKNLYKLGYFGFNNDDVPDPFFFDGYYGFETVYKMIDTCVQELFKEHL